MIGPPLVFVNKFLKTDTPTCLYIVCATRAELSRNEQTLWLYDRDHTYSMVYIFHGHTYFMILKSVL